MLQRLCTVAMLMAMCPVYADSGQALDVVVPTEAALNDGSVSSGIEFFELAGLKSAKKILPNDLEIVAIRQPAAPKVNVTITLRKIGGNIENDGEKGLAHLIEHMIFKGTVAPDPRESLNEGTYRALCQRYAADHNAFTWFDTTSYYILADANNWKPFLHLYAQCMQYAAFDPQHLASEVKVVIKELRRDRDDAGRRLIETYVRTLVPREHPHHGYTIGYKEDLANVRSETLKAFFDRYYRASTATLFLIGDLDLADAISAAEAEFSVLPKVEVVLPQPFEKHYDLNVGFHKKLYDERTTEVAVVGWQMPPGVCDELFRAMMLTSLLVGGDNGRLIKRLVHEEKCASGVDVHYEPTQGTGYFHVILMPLPGQLERCVDLVHEELQKIATSGVDTAELVRDMEMHRLAHAKKLEGLANSTYGIDPEWVIRYALSHNLDDAFNHVERLARVTPEDIKAFVATYLTPALSSRIDLLPAPESEIQARIEELEYEQEVEECILAAHVRTTPVEEAVIPDVYPPARPIAVELPHYHLRTVLSNGLTVIVRKDTSSPLCSFTMQHRNHEDFSASLDGVALGVLGELLLQGSKGATREEIADWFESRGLSASVGGTAWSLFGLEKDFLVGLEHLFTTVLTANLAQEDLEKIKHCAVASLKEAQDDPFAIACRLENSSIWPHSVRDWTFADAIAMLTALNVPMMRDYMVRYLDPAALVVSVVGNVEPSDVVAALERSTQEWQGSGWLPKVFEVPAPSIGNIDVPLTRDQVLVLYARQAPLNVFHPDYPAITVASEILFGSHGGRLYKLREATGLFYILQGVFGRGAGKTPGADWIITQTGPELLDAAHEHIERFIESEMVRPITQSELDAARASVRAEFASGLSTTGGKAKYFLGLECKGLDTSYYEKFLASVDALTPEEVTNAVARYMAAGAYNRIQVGMIPR